MMIYMISETGATATNNETLAAAMETAGYRRCTLDEYRAKMCRIAKDDELASQAEQRKRNESC